VSRRRAPLDRYKLLERYRHHLLVERYRSRETWLKYRGTLLDFWAFCGKDPAKAQPRDVHRFLDRPLAESTRAAYAVRIKPFYRWAAGARLLPRDPLATCMSPPVHPGPPRALDVADVRKLLIAAQPNPRLHLIVWLAYGAGLRAGEIVRLRIEDVFLSGRPQLRVRGKGNRPRAVPFCTPGWSICSPPRLRADHRPAR
jgi:site-specific recombinase XerD